MKFGVPYDVAWSLPASERMAYIVVFGELDGGEFCFTRWRWIEKNDG